MKKKKIISQICIHVILVALTAICLLPFLSMISTSFIQCVVKPLASAMGI